MKMPSPYSKLGKSAFWSTAVAATAPAHMDGIYQKKWEISPQEKIALAGSCFAQHIARYLRAANFNVMDMEPAPSWVPAKAASAGARRPFDAKVAPEFGYQVYSARYGNIYTVQQLLQLAMEAFGLFEPQFSIWELGEKFVDAQRPAIEPEGLDSITEVFVHRQAHLQKVRDMFLNMDVFVFTLGLTESWVHAESGTVYPTAPGTIAGSYDPDIFTYKNFTYQESYEAFIAFMDLLQRKRSGKAPLKTLLTVSPVPLTATASGRHVLSASIYSKSLLRTLAGELSQHFAQVDYFPSFEIITNPAAKSTFFEQNLRTVRPEAVDIVMKQFFGAHDSEGVLAPKTSQINAVDEQCDDYLLESFK